jgi:hypothetical protein
MQIQRDSDHALPTPTSCPFLISDEPQLVIPGLHSGTRNPELEVEKALDSGFCPRGQPRNDGVWPIARSLAELRH